ncbi:MAG: hypothetical protein WD058_04420 [Dehalococcoidia bacterium]
MRVAATVALLVVALVALAVALAGCGAADAPRMATPTPGPEERFQTPATLQSYRYTVSIEANTDLIDTGTAPAGLQLDDAVLYMDIEGRRVSPDREYMSASSEFGYLSLDRETIVVGERLWSRQQNGAWRQRATLQGPEDFIGQDVALSPSVILGTDDADFLERLTAELEARPHTFEDVNERQTRHWSFTDEEVAIILDPAGNTIPGMLPPAGVRVDVWTDIETGVAVRIIMVAASEDDPEAFRLTMDLFDLNDPSITVDEPESAIGE